MKSVRVVIGGLAMATAFAGGNVAIADPITRSGGGLPNKPARSAVKVAGLAVPGRLVEIELVAVRKN